MKTRIITGLVLIPILVLILISDGPIITAAVTIVTIIGLYEFFKATGLLEKKALAALGFLIGLGVSLRLYIPKEYYTALFFAALILLFFVMLKWHKTVCLTDSGVMLFGVIYIPYLLSFLSAFTQVEGGYFCLWLIFIGAFSTDTFAYFTGVFLGKHKLCVEISPKKTIEGSIGGMLGAIILLLLYGLLLEKVFKMNINYIKLGILGLVISPISQIGDLTASIIKRKYGIKDYGNLFPGHGGILDRLDSVIAVAPLVYIYVTTIGLG